MGLLLLRKGTRRRRIQQTVLHIVMGRVHVIPLAIHLDGRPHMASTCDASCFHARRFKQLHVGGMIPLASDRHAGQSAIDSHVAIGTVIADVVDDPVVQHEGRFIIVPIPVRQTLGNDFAGPLVRVDEALPLHIDADRETLV